ncbi:MULTISPECIES: hypothetical protein [unclassified Amycolatopsis]|uniref:hypothetical protein n=1 Tax=unclassified Amycolatopsis TaxID=2618356 RepID=UPI0028766C50|nr:MULTISPECIES: hypothetical protein [unclassified Amycolatopsis]MDS0136706.1 hypothetical protein [Amycolatopsis sp. 505]MDS0143371.1 hypothetical protein [Amycolatopsis sp. CM201R]
MRDTKVDLCRLLGHVAAGGFITVAFGLVGAGAAHAGPRIAIPGDSDGTAGAPAPPGMIGTIQPEANPKQDDGGKAKSASFDDADESGAREVVLGDTGGKDEEHDEDDSGDRDSKRDDGRVRDHIDSLAGILSEDEDGKDDADEPPLSSPTAILSDRDDPEDTADTTRAPSTVERFGGDAGALVHRLTGGPGDYGAPDDYDVDHVEDVLAANPENKFPLYGKEPATTHYATSTHEEPAPDDVHDQLDYVGVLPVLGEVADTVNAGIYLAEGDPGAALLTMPVVGKYKAVFKIAQAVGDAITGAEPEMVVVEDGTTRYRFPVVTTPLPPPSEAEVEQMAGDYEASRLKPGNSPYLPGTRPPAAVTPEQFEKYLDDWVDLRPVPADFQGGPVVWRRIQAGNLFNWLRSESYDYSEVRTERRKYIDSYDPGDKIVERKYTDIQNVKPTTVNGYLGATASKYRIGDIVSDTPANQAKERRNATTSDPKPIVGRPIGGKHILEVPEQDMTKVPAVVRERAKELDINICDTGNECVFKVVE